ncbi:MAG: hypothetical protein ACP6IP_05345 [Candidatus Njordarchaeia archaeon]
MSWMEQQSADGAVIFLAVVILNYTNLFIFLTYLLSYLSWEYHLALEAMSFFICLLLLSAQDKYFNDFSYWPIMYLSTMIFGTILIPILD